MKKLLPTLLITLLFFSCTSETTTTTVEDISSVDVLQHIRYLASDSLAGREAGTPQETIAANYIADHFRNYGLEPAGNDQTYFQNFTINTSVLRNPHTDTSASDAEKRLSKNVAGMLQGTGESNDLIIIGAHYDHLGLGEFGSLYTGDPLVHNGADDNASGTAGVLELAEYFSENRPQSNLLFLAFSGEEMGLLGSEFYANNPTVDLDQAIAMINMDMIGRLQNNRLMIFGTGTTDSWESILQEANSDSLNLELVPDGTGSSDHTSFYYKNIPVLHYFTDTHADYHRPSDDADYINADGEEKVLRHVKRVILNLDEMDREELAFTAAPGEQRQSMRLEGPTLGVLPDYGFDGKGMRITGVNENGPADQAGLKGGDIIIGIAGEKVEDIYGYMGALNKLSKGQKTTITVNRDGEELTLELNL